MSRPPAKTYVVPVTMTDERRVVVEARTAEEARQKVSRGQYRRLGRSRGRGFLIVGKAEEVAGA